MRLIALSFVCIAGIAATLVSAHYLFQDWAALNIFYAKFERVVNSAAPFRSVFIAQAQQNAFRINCFADGVGVLLGGILAAIGIHGLCLLRPAQARK